MKRVFITGVSSGIGLGLAGRLIERGSVVAGVSRRETVLDDAERFHFRALDVTCSDDVHRVVGELAEEAGPFDVAILNAGILGEIQDIREASIAAMKATMDVNVWANKTLIDALAALETPPQQIVAISSGASVNGSRGWNGYAISKAALNMLVKQYAAELPNIHFTALAPGLVDTAMQDVLCSLDGGGQFPSLDAIQAKRHTPQMPTGDAVAARLIEAMERLPELVASGDYVDIRLPPLATE